MVRAGARLPSFCLSRVAISVRAVRSSSPKPISGATNGCEAAAFSGGIEKLLPGGGEGERAVAEGGRRIMVVVDSSRESRCALQWALSHAVQVHDTVVLLSVAGLSKQGGGGSQRAAELLLSMKNVCQARKPGVKVEECAVDGEERGPAVVEAARKQGASLLILGQRRRSITWRRLLMLWACRRASTRTCCLVDYCIQNAACMTLAVRRRSRRAGGYLITTRRHKDFWLLA